MLGSTLGQDIDSKVCLVDVVIVSCFILLCHLVTLLLKVHKCRFELFLLLLETRLDNLSTSEQSFLQVLQSFVLDHDGCLFIKWSRIIESKLL
jgi:hypothetical protein